MKIITIAQPFASAAVLGGIKALSMPFQTAYRGPLVIVAGRTHPKMRRSDIMPQGSHLAQRPPGSVMGIVELCGCSCADDGCDFEWVWDQFAWTISTPRVFELDLAMAAGPRLSNLHDAESEPIELGSSPALEWLNRYGQCELEKRMANANPNDFRPTQPGGFTGD